MSDTFAKLASKIVTSSIWQLDDHVRLVWITMLAMKDKNHEVTASVPGLAHIARVPLESCIRALEVLSAPDPLNPKGPDEGRRIKETENGWFIINGEKYRWYGKELEDKEMVRLRVERFRLKHKLKPTPIENVTVGNDQVTSGNASNDKQNQKHIQNNKEESVEKVSTVDDASSIASSIAKRKFINKGFDSNEFLQAFSSWNKYRIEIRKRLTQSTIKKQLAFLDSLGSPEAAIASINQSIEKGWQGLFSVNGKNNGQQTLPGLSPAQATYQHQEELKRVEAAMSHLKNNASADAMGPIYSADEKKKLSELIARRSQLCDLLGFPK